MKKKYYIIVKQKPSGPDIFIWGLPWTPNVNVSNGEQLLGPYTAYKEAKRIASEIQATNKPENNVEA